MVAQAFQGTEGEGQLATLVENQKFAVFAVKSTVAAAPPPFAAIRGDLLADCSLPEAQTVARDKAAPTVTAGESGKELTVTAPPAVPANGTAPPTVRSRARPGQKDQPATPDPPPP